jgi:hypothetical protein
LGLGLAQSFAQHKGAEGTGPSGLIEILGTALQGVLIKVKTARPRKKSGWGSLKERHQGQKQRIGQG